MPATDKTFLLEHLIYSLLTECNDNLNKYNKKLLLKNTYPSYNAPKYKKHGKPFAKCYQIFECTLILFM